MAEKKIRDLNYHEKFTYGDFEWTVGDQYDKLTAMWWANNGDYNHLLYGGTVVQVADPPPPPLKEGEVYVDGRFTFFIARKRGDWKSGELEVIPNDGYTFSPDQFQRNWPDAKKVYPAPAEDNTRPLTWHPEPHSGWGTHDGYPNHYHHSEGDVYGIYESHSRKVY